MSFWKNFGKIFDIFPSSKSYDEMSEDLDSDILNLYYKMGWGQYTNPLKTTYILNPDMQLVSLEKDMKNNITKTSTNPSDTTTTTFVTSQQFLDEMIKLVPSGPFVPYAYYNEDMDSIQVYFKDENSYTQPLNKWLELHLSHDTDEIVGVNVLNVRKVLKHETE